MFVGSLKTLGYLFVSHDSKDILESSGKFQAAYPEIHSTRTFVEEQ